MDKVAANSRFLQVFEAYTVLSNKDRRSIYDSFGNYGFDLNRMFN